jgi:hypothetical protein
MGDGSLNDVTLNNVSLSFLSLNNVSLSFLSLNNVSLDDNTNPDDRCETALLCCTIMMQRRPLCDATFSAGVGHVPTIQCAPHFCLSRRVIFEAAGEGTVETGTYHPRDMSSKGRRIPYKNAHST